MKEASRKFEPLPRLFARLGCSAGSYSSHVYALEFKVQRAVNGYQSHGSGTIVEYLARGRLIFDGYQHAFTAGVTAARRVISLGG